MKKTKEFVKKYMIGLTLSFLICLITVSAITYFDSKNITYDNEMTGMTSTNVQEAVNELYSVCFPKIGGDAILNNEEIVTNGDGLYKDEYEDRYFYRGKNVNNYITFNNETWRIISIESDKTIKIIKQESIGDIAWDSSSSNNWAKPATLNTYLNGSYLTSTLNSTAQNQIVAKNFGIGVVNINDTNLANSIKDENESIWNGKVALITASEYIRTNSDQNNCGTPKQLWEDTNGQCRNTTWTVINDEWWTLSPNDADIIFVVTTFGNLFNDYSQYSTDAVRPVVYLSSDVKITGGDGSQNNPYALG